MGQVKQELNDKKPKTCKAMSSRILWSCEGEMPEAMSKVRR